MMFTCHLCRFEFELDDRWLMSLTEKVEPSVCIGCAARHGWETILAMTKLLRREVTSALNAA